MAQSDRYFSKIGVLAAFSGLVIYGAGAVLHPWTLPHEAEAALADTPSPTATTH